MEKSLAKSAEQRPPVVKTPQSIVHIKHRITLRQYKYWVLLLRELKDLYDQNAPSDEDGFFSISMEKIAEKIGYVPTKTELRSDLEAIRKEPISFNVLSKDGQQEQYGAGFISEYYVSTKKIRFKFPSFLEKVMRGLDEPKSMFSLINWNVFNHFTGKYEAIIYKLCKDYVNSPTNRTPDMTLQQFREYMGIKDEEYQEFKKLNARVISEPVKKINESEVSDIIIQPQLHKEGRNVIGLYFSVQHKKQTSLPFPEMPGSEVFKFAKVPISAPTQTEYLAIRSADEISLCIERGNEYGERLEKSGKPANYGAIYRTAINEGWHIDYAATKEKRAKKAAVQIAEFEEAEAKKQAEADSKKNDQEEKKAALEWFESLEEHEKKEVEEEFINKANATDTRLFRTRGPSCTPFKIFLKGRYKK